MTIGLPRCDPASRVNYSRLSRHPHKTLRFKVSSFPINGTKSTVEIILADALAQYARWPAPTVIVSDGAYGISGFLGDASTAEGLPEWYEPHVAAWSQYSTPGTELWFWNTELGWATIHPVLLRHGWEFRNCHVWDKGIGHIAGNANTKTLRKFPVVTEVCVQYVKAARFRVADREMSMKEWLRYEWQRSGLALSLTNEACGVKNAATRKYFTQCHLWYYPPPDAFKRLVAYANRYGDGRGQPPYHPAMMVQRLVYAYCMGKPSSRQIERATDEEIPYRILAANQHPDHDSLAAFRQRHVAALAGLFGQVLQRCQRAGLVRLGHVALDGTTSLANASKHKAMRDSRMGEAEQQLPQEIAALLAQAAAVDAVEDAQQGTGRRGDALPAELARRERRGLLPPRHIQRRDGAAETE